MRAEVCIAPPAGAHGGDGERVARALGMPGLLDLSQSLNPLAADPAPVISRHLDAVRHYPDASDATRALADTMGVERDHLLLTNGGAEAIALVAAELGGGTSEPEFSLHPRGDGPRWRSNPHNPTGSLAGPDERADVWDEAFYPLATGAWTRGDEGAVVVGSLTKVLACPGLRLGYVLAGPDVIGRTGRRQPAWAVNGLAAAALPELLERVDLGAWAPSITKLRADLVQVLGAHGLAPLPSQANWVLVDHPGLRQTLAPHGVLVRDCANFGMPGVHRIAVPSAEGLAVLDSALDAVFERMDPS